MIPQYRSCGSCNTVFGKKYLKKCSNCRRAEYCSKECQNSAWPSHKRVCNLLRTSRKETDGSLPSIQNPSDRTKAQAIRRAIAESPSQSHYLHAGLAHLTVMQNRVHEGLKMYDQALQMPLADNEDPPAYANTHCLIGRLFLHNKKNRQRAKEAFQTAL